MFWNASALNGFPIRAKDGLVGSVADMLCAADGWSVRWLVVDTGTWLSGRRVLVPASAAGQPDAQAHEFPVDLTMRQIEESPVFESDEALSPESELSVSKHYGAPLGSDLFVPNGLGSATPDVAALSRPPRGLAAITGNSIEATDGEIGHAEDFLIDTATWQVRYMVVHTSSWWPGEKVLVSPLSVDWIDRARGIIHLDVTRQKVKDSPPYVEPETVDGAYEALFHSYYGFRGPRR